MAMNNYVILLDAVVQRGAALDAVDSVCDECPVRLHSIDMVFRACLQEGATPLIVAFRSGFIDFGLELITLGADVSVRDKVCILAVSYSVETVILIYVWSAAREERPHRTSLGRRGDQMCWAN
jgi:hypothetical protein